MPTKKIQLRGISRTPSDRMSADGGLAESIGFENNMQELAVIVPATDVTTELGLNDEVQDAEVVYIHKTNDYTHYLGIWDEVTTVDEHEVHHKHIGWFTSTQTFVSFLEHGLDENVKEIKSVGNTLIILIADTDGNTKRMEYVLFKNGSYLALGHELPEPKITIVPEALEDETQELEGRTIVNLAYKRDISFAYQATASSDEGIALSELCLSIGVDAWKVIPDSDKRKEVYNILQNGLRAKISENNNFNLVHDALSFPLIMRYALRLYDGSYVRHSAPILVDPNNSQITEMLSYLNYNYSNDNDTKTGEVESDSTHHFMFPYRLNLTYQIEQDEDLEKWKDIIISVDLFCTPSIEQFTLDMLYIDGDHRVGPNWYTKDPRVFYLKTLTETEKKENILNCSNFYKIKSYDWESIYNSVDGVLPLEKYDELFGINLQTKDMLPDDKGSNNNVLANNLFVYNERLMIVGSKTRLFAGPYCLPSRQEESRSVRILYKINTAGGERRVLRKETKAEPGPWMFYPDARCYEAVMYGYTILVSDPLRYRKDKCVVPMTEHPYLNGAYSFVGYGNEPYQNGWESTDEIFDTLEELWASIESEVEDVEDNSNSLVQSNVFNLFLFPIQQTFQAKITDVAVITKALSTGQFGYSSLYIFTDEGLWAMKATIDGSLGQPDVVSQDVALPGTVCQLDQAVVFTTKKGVMLLTGSDLRCISDRMHGRHYKLDTSIYTLLTTFFATEWGELAEMAHEDMPFMEYMAGARTAYDYVGRRLLFFKETNPLPYIYAYMIETDSWHKVIIPAGFEFKSVLNSYPDTYIAMDRKEEVTEDEMATEKRYAAVMCFSNARSQDDYTRYKGMIVTRPIDLDEDDVRKVLNRLFVRGSYPKEAQVDGADIGSPVKMLLLGSEDGLTWQKLRSFRGGSYKLFRLVLLCQLTQAERISYVEAEFETRYTGRLR